MASLGLDVSGVSATTTLAWSSNLGWSTLILRMLQVFLQQPHRPCFHGGKLSVDTYIHYMYARLLCHKSKVRWTVSFACENFKFHFKVSI